MTIGGTVARSIRRLTDRRADVRRAAESQARLLAEARRGFNEVERLSGVGSWTFDLVNRRVTWSDQQYRVFALAPGDIEPSYEAYLDIVHPDDRQRVAAIIADTIETRSPLAYTCRIVCAGTTRRLQARGLVSCDEAGAPIFMDGTTQDVTEREETAAASRLSINRFELAARATHDALWDWDIAAGTFWWNEAFYDTFGYARGSAAAAGGRTSLIHADDAQQVTCSLEAFLASGEDAWSCEYRFRCEDGGYVWVLDRGFAVRDTSGVALRMLGSMMNITARKKADRLKGDFAAFASHQLRTPLAGINWTLELALNEPHVPEAARRHVIDAAASAHRLVQLVNDLLDVSRLESAPLPTSLETFRLEPLTTLIVSELRSSFADKRHLVVLNLAGATAPVHADAQLVRQAIINLVSNALRYTPAAGTITIEVVQRPGAVRWSITDTGIGIAKHAQGHLFEKFWRADNAVAVVTEGTGLGLHLVRLIVEHSGGTIWCDSDGEGQGSTFTFELPTETAA